MIYVQHLKVDRLECEVEETRSKIRDLCDKADATVEDMASLIDVEEADDIQHNINELQKIVLKLKDIKDDMEDLENSVTTGIEGYDAVENR